MEDYETLKIFIKSVFNLDDDVSFLIEYSKENGIYIFFNYIKLYIIYMMYILYIKYLFY